MSDLSGFYAYNDPVAKTGPTLFPYDPVGQVLSIPSGSTNIAIPLAKIQPVIDAAKKELDQDLTDYEEQPGTVVRNAAGHPLITISVTIADGTPPTMAGCTIGNPMSVAKGHDFIDGATRLLASMAPPAP